MITINILFFIYLITVLIFTHGFDRVKEFKPTDAKPNTNFTIIIVFRNEEENLPVLLESLIRIDYPEILIEFIFIDDNSSDSSTNIIKEHFKHTKKEFQILKNIRSSNSPKKDAITLAIKKSKYNWIITTDADCKTPRDWLKTIDSFIRENSPNMIVAPVTYLCNNSFLQQFQLLDFLSLQASTISGFGLKKPFLCSGANFAYKKELFNTLDGFTNNNDIASGDDIFLLEKFLKFNKKKVHYLKSNTTIVSTLPENSWKRLIHQRTRWASKTTNYKSVFGKLIGVIIFIGNTIIIASPMLCYYGILDGTSLISYFLMKLFFDFLLIKRVSSFYGLKIHFFNYLLSSILYPYFTLLIFCKSMLGSYKWKNRTFSK